MLVTLATVMLIEKVEPGLRVLSSRIGAASVVDELAETDAIGVSTTIAASVAKIIHNGLFFVLALNKHPNIRLLNSTLYLCVTSKKTQNLKLISPAFSNLLGS